jgi:hypothetical protein
VLAESLDVLSNIPDATPACLARLASARHMAASCRDDSLDADALGQEYAELLA